MHVDREFVFPIRAIAQHRTCFSYIGWTQYNISNMIRSDWFSGVPLIDLNRYEHSVAIFHRFGSNNGFRVEKFTDLVQKISHRYSLPIWTKRYLNRLPIWIKRYLMKNESPTDLDRVSKFFYWFGSVIQNGKRYFFEICHCFYRSGSDSLPIWIYDPNR